MVKDGGNDPVLISSARVWRTSKQKMERQAHWEGVYTQKGETQVSWFPGQPGPSLELIRKSDATADSAFIDIGGGTSRLVAIPVIGGVEDVTSSIYPTCHFKRPKPVKGARTGSWIVADATCGSR